MVNSNPETVSTIRHERQTLLRAADARDVLNIYDQEKPEGVIVQFGGQTPLNLADGLRAAGVPIIGTQPESIEIAEDRKLFAAMLDKLGLRQTPNGSAVSANEAVAIANKIGYPVLVRPSFVLGGRAMELVYNDEDLRHYMENARNTGILPVQSRGRSVRQRQAESLPNESGETPELRPILVDRFLEDAIEVDVDCIADGEIAVMARYGTSEQAGIHSGDSACVIPLFAVTKSSRRNHRRDEKRWRAN